MNTARGLLLGFFPRIDVEEVFLWWFVVFDMEVLSSSRFVRMNVDLKHVMLLLELVSLVPVRGHQRDENHVVVNDGVHVGGYRLCSVDVLSSSCLVVARVRHQLSEAVTVDDRDLLRVTPPRQGFT